MYFGLRGEDRMNWEGICRMNMNHMIVLKSLESSHDISIKAHIKSLYV